MAVGDPADLAGRSLAIIGVIWPSKKFDELVAASGEDQAVGGGAGLNTSAASDPASLAAVTAKLDAMERFFADPSDVQRLRRARALLPDLEDKATARRQFVEELRGLLDPSAANKEDASTRFFKDDGNDIMKNLQDRRQGSRQGAFGTAGRRVAAGGGRRGCRRRWRRRRIQAEDCGLPRRGDERPELHDLLRDEGARRHGRQERRGAAHRRSCAAGRSDPSRRPQFRRAGGRGRRGGVDDRQDPQHVAAADARSRTTASRSR